jgi:CRISPR/Cas system endoribonuclease Cas6 (RAMP superfamily)
MGGLVGEIVIQDLDPWLYSWLRAAELLHVGKGAAMGLGRIEISGDAHA